MLEYESKVSPTSETTSVKPNDQSMVLRQDTLIEDLCAILCTYLDSEQVEQVRRGYHFAAEAHHGQKRKSGEDYICHPLSVAIILAEMRMDVNGILAAILHDVVEDTEVTKEELADLFSEEVAELVDGVTKLAQVQHISKVEAQAENVRKMLLAMSRDLRVIMVKLADRLHNMRTLGHMPREKKQRIAKETLEIYSPLASRLGMNQIRMELEEHGFGAMYPLRHKVLENAVKKARGHRREVLATIEAAIQKRMREIGLQCQIVGREKHLYSIYQKMVQKKRSFEEVFDVYAFRILTQTVDECYRSLGVIHGLYKPKPTHFKDYIALPKGNGYQSLHTVLVGPYDFPLEIQIRTWDMHRMAESGIGAHWLYKAENTHGVMPNAQDRAHEWVRDLLEIQKTAGDSLEFIDNLKVDLFPQEIFIFTPKGGIIKLPKGATIVDFAYAVHTDIGNSCVSARVDGLLTPLQTRLENGQMVHIITSECSRPSPLWLNYVVTAKARASIRSYFRHFKSKEAISIGQRLLEKQLKDLGTSIDEIGSDRLHDLILNMEIESVDHLLEDIGLGNRMPFLIAKRLCQVDVNSGIKLNEEGPSSASLIIKGSDGMVVSLAKCCKPLPGDHIIGFFNPGKGIVVHRTECKNSAEFRRKNETWLDVEWQPDVDAEFSAELRLQVKNQRGTLATIASTISSMGSNIENVAIRDQDAHSSVDMITFAVKDRVHLANVIRALKKLPIVMHITRVRA